MFNEVKKSASVQRAEYLKSMFVIFSLLSVLSIMLISSTSLNRPTLILGVTWLTLLSGWGWIRTEHYIKAHKKEETQEKNSEFKDALVENIDNSQKERKSVNETLAKTEIISGVWRGVGTIRGFFSTSTSYFAAAGKALWIFGL